MAFQNFQPEIRGKNKKKENNKVPSLVTFIWLLRISDQATMTLIFFFVSKYTSDFFS